MSTHRNDSPGDAAPDADIGDDTTVGLDDDHTVPADRRLRLGDDRTVGVDLDRGEPSGGGIADDRTAAAESEVVRLIRARAKAMRESATPTPERAAEAPEPSVTPRPTTSGPRSTTAVRSTTPPSDRDAAPVRTVRAQSSEHGAPRPGVPVRPAESEVPVVSLATGQAPAAGAAWEPGAPVVAVPSPAPNRRGSGMRNFVVAVLLVIAVVGLVAYLLVRP